MKLTSGMRWINVLGTVGMPKRESRMITIERALVEDLLIVSGYYHIVKEFLGEKIHPDVVSVIECAKEALKR